MSGNHKIALVTGGNTGLGYEIAKALYESPETWRILLISGRDFDKAVRAVRQITDDCSGATNIIEAFQLDIEDDSSINEAVDIIRTKYSRVDALINNAGAVFDGKIGTREMSMRAAWLQSWNIVASKDCRIVFVTSGTANLTEHGNNPKIDAVPGAGWPKADFRDARAYRSTKVGLNMMMREWSRFFKADNVKVFSVSPGVLATGLAGIGKDNMKKMGAADASVGGQLIRDIAEGHRDQDEGLVINAHGTQPW